MSDNIFGIELSNGCWHVIYTNCETVEELMKEIEKSDWIGFKTDARWREREEVFEFEHCLYKASEIVSISW